MGMRHLKIYEEYTQKFTAKEVGDYIREITPEPENVPEFFIEKILKSGKEFELKSVKIKDLLVSDPDLKEYVSSDEDRYEEPVEEDLSNPIVVLDNEVLDGYSRISTMFKRGEEEIQAYTA